MVTCEHKPAYLVHPLLQSKALNTNFALSHLDWPHKAHIEIWQCKIAAGPVDLCVSISIYIRTILRVGKVTYLYRTLSKPFYDPHVVMSCTLDLGWKKPKSQVNQYNQWGNTRDIAQGLDKRVRPQEQLTFSFLPCPALPSHTCDAFTADGHRL